MSTNMEMLRDKMAKCNISNGEMARKMGIDESTFYRKLKSDGTTFTVGQMHTIVDVLQLAPEEATAIFLWNNSHKCEC